MPNLLFGWELKRKEEDEEKKVSFVEPDNEDGAISVAAGPSGGVFGASYIDLDNAAKNEAQLISKYRMMEQHPDVASAVEDIVNEAIITSEEGKIVDINLENTEFPESIKKKITDEFTNILRLMDFSNKGYEVFNRFYVDGRLRYHVIIDETDTKKGILELRFVDPRKLRRVKEIEKKKDPQSEAIIDDRRHMTMMEDFWLPRREGGRGTEISTLPGGQTLGEMDDVLYFQKNLYKALNVPISRMEPETGFTLGRASEITRDEIKFSRFVQRLRQRFSIIFDEVLEKQLVLKNILTPEEWKKYRDLVRFDFQEDNHFEELKAAEILRERIATLDQIEPHIGSYFSREWIRRNRKKILSQVNWTMY